jgi:outer membrane biosynthesis protein TonB
MTETRRIFAAVGGSLLVHLMLFLLMVLWLRWRPDFSLPDFASSKPAPLEVTIEPLQLAPAPPPVPIESDGLAKADTAPKNPLFESDVNSRAGSQLPARGTLPLPSQEGKERPSPEFEDRRAEVGEINKPPAAEGRPVPPQSAVPPTPRTAEIARQEPPKPEARPVPFKPTPAGREGILPRPTPVPPREVPVLATPAPTPRSTPAPTVAKKVEDVAMLRPTPRPVARPSRPPGSNAGYQAQRERTRIEGNISNRGARGVDAIGTPIGRYRKDLAAAIGSRWNRYVRDKMDLITIGSVHVRFYINRNGKAERLTVVNNTSNSAFEIICLMSISQAEIPPLPPEVAPVLENNRMEIDYTFTIYPN